jgi:hypothetical protein
MTEPAPPIPAGGPENSLTWCSRCQVHYATATKPLCVGCLDIETRGR